MAARVSPTEKRPTHHISLTDNVGTTIAGLRLIDPTGMGEASMQRTSLKMAQGDPDYSDYNLPFTPFTQKDWSGGRAQENYEDDRTRYSDSYNVDTTRGKVILAPKATLTTGFDTNESNGMTTALKTYFRTNTGSGIGATSFVAAASTTYNSLDLLILNTYSTPAPVTVKIYTDTGTPAHAPNTLVSGTTSTVYVPGIQSPSDTIAPVRFPLTFTATASTMYWIVVSIPDTYPDFNGIEFGYYASAGNDLMIAPLGSWIADREDMRLSYKFTFLGSSSTKFFEYKGALYAVVNNAAGTAPRLFINGYRGTCISGSALGFVTAAVADIDLGGKIVKIVAGTGYDQFTNWRAINAGSGLAGDYGVTPNWTVAPDATTEIVILGCNTWTEIAGGSDGHYLTKSVTDICVANGIVYFAQGEATTMRRMREYNNAGTWTREFEWDGTDATTGNKATFLELVPATTGKYYVWKFNNPTNGDAPTACYAPLIAWSATTDLDFTTKPTEIVGDWPIKVGDSTSKITGVTLYGTPTMPWVFKEDSFGAISDGIFAPVPIAEMKSAKSEENGKAATQFGVYLYFSLLDGVEKYYDNRLDDVGPNRDEGLPTLRRGAVSKLIPYPGRVIAMVDAGDAGQSAIFINLTGWHEIHRGDTGRRIRDGMVQIIPGNTTDRLWFEQGGEIYWLPMAINPETVDGYEYETTGYLISSWMNGGFGEVNKFWSQLQCFAENLTANVKLTGYYQTDVSTTWTQLGTEYTTSPVQKVAISSTNSCYGKRWRYKIALTTNAAATTPKLNAVTVEAVTRVPPKATWRMSVFADDAMVDLQGTRETLSAKGLLDLLKKWADSDQEPLPLTMHSTLAIFDGKTVYIESPSIRPANININGARKTVYAVECNVIEV